MKANPAKARLANFCGRAIWCSLMDFPSKLAWKDKAYLRLRLQILDAKWHGTGLIARTLLRITKISNVNDLYKKATAFGFGNLLRSGESALEIPSASFETKVADRWISTAGVTRSSYKSNSEPIWL